MYCTARFPADSLVEVTAEVSVPIDHQADDYNAVFEALGAGQYSITVQAENIIGLGPMSDTVSVSVPSIGTVQCTHCSTCVVYTYIHVGCRQSPLIIMIDHICTCTCSF